MRKKHNNVNAFCFESWPSCSSCQDDFAILLLDDVNGQTISLTDGNFNDKDFQAGRRDQCQLAGFAGCFHQLNPVENHRFLFGSIYFPIDTTSFHWVFVGSL